MYKHIALIGKLWYYYLGQKGAFISMPRKSRISSRTNFYHLMVQGLNKDFIFDDETHIKSYKNILLKKLKKSNVLLLAYCIMNNHAHLLVYSKKVEYISKYMQKVNMSYSHYFNNKHHRVGYVFRDRYRSQIILNKKQLLTCLHYIHNNPVKARIVNNMSDYAFSSYNEFLGKKELISNKSISLLFDNPNDYINEFKLIHNISNTDSFIDVKDISISDFIKTFEIENNVKLEDIKKNSKLIKKFVNQSRIETDIKIKDLAKILKISKSSVGNISKNIS